MVIGISLGSGIGPGILQQASDWAFSLLLLLAGTALMLLTAASLLQRFAGLDRETALIASCPGAMSLTLALVAEGRGDAAAILAVQSMRLLVLAALLPLAIALLGLTEAEVPPRPAAAPVALALLLAAGLVASACLRRLRVPAAFLLGGMAASATAHVAGWVHGFPPQWLLFTAFALAGSAIGAQFSGIAPRQLLRSGNAIALAVGTALMFSAAFAAAAALAAGLPFATAWVAFAPGGIEAMSAIGLALGFDAAFIAVHHFARIHLLAGWVPFLVRPG